MTQTITNLIMAFSTYTFPQLTIDHYVICIRLKNQLTLIIIEVDDTNYNNDVFLIVDGL